jgi:alpha-glucosidase
MAGVARFWLGRGVDGFRVDVLWLLGKDPELRDNPADPDWHDGLPGRLRLLREHSEDGPRAHEYVRFLRAVVDEYPDRVMIGEVVLPGDRAVAFYGAALDEAHLPHNFALTQLERWTADDVRSVVERHEGVMPDGAWPNWLLGDHDFPRIASRVGPERARLAMALLLTLRGTPTWYYGDELGLPDADRSPPGMADPQAAAGDDRDRLLVRTPMPWTPGRHGGFSEAEPWLPLSSDDPALTVERQRGDPGSHLELFRSLVRLRRERPALSIGAYRSLPAPEGVLSFERWHPRDAVHVHLNFGPSPRSVDLGAGRILLTTSGSLAEGTRLTLRGHEAAIVEVEPDGR